MTIVVISSDVRFLAPRSTDAATRKRGLTDLRELIAEFELVTPAFCGGANNEKVAEIRLPLILGQLRWWWRALAWSCAPGADESTRLAKVHEWERKLFGSADHGTGAFTARLIKVPPPKTVTTSAPADYIGGYEWDGLTNSCRTDRRGQDGLAYLAGLGIAERLVIPDTVGFGIPKNKSPRIAKKRVSEIQKGEGRNYLQGPQDTRPSIREGERVAIMFRAPRGGDLSISIDNIAPTLDEALNALGLLGGIGSRWRRGFGSLRRVDGASHTSVEQFREAITRLLGRSLNNTSAPYSTAGGNSDFRLIQSNSGEQLAAFHNRVGRDFQDFRTNWSVRLKQLGRQGNFWSDHQWFLFVSDPENFKRDDPAHPSKNIDASYPSQSTLHSAEAAYLPERLAYGLPHDYTSRNFQHNPSPREVKLNLGPDTSNKSARRASPLFLHLHAMDGRPVAVWYRLDSRFLPSGVKLVVKPSSGRKPNVVTLDSPWPVTLASDPSLAPIDAWLSTIR